MKIILLPVIALCVSCGPVENIVNIESPDGKIKLEVKEQLRGASSSNSYFINYIDKKYGPKELFESYSGSYPEVVWINKSSMGVCTEGEDRYMIVRSIKTSVGKLSIQHMDKSIYENCTL